jgi:hypothetical protein
MENIKQKTFKDYTSKNTCKQRIEVLVLSCIEFLKISFASLLSIFVPQNCNGRICSVYENFIDLSAFNIFAIIVNFVLFGLFIITYIYELKREFFMLEHFDTMKDYPDNHLTLVINKYDSVNKQINNFNKHYNKLCISLYVFFFFNWIVSAVLVFHYFYLDKTTISTMITNFLLVFTKIHKGYMVSGSIKDKLYVSCFLPENFVYNIMNIEKYGEHANQPYTDNNNDVVLVG